MELKPNSFPHQNIDSNSQREKVSNAETDRLLREHAQDIWTLFQLMTEIKTAASIIVNLKELPGFIVELANFIGTHFEYVIAGDGQSTIASFSAHEVSLLRMKIQFFQQVKKQLHGQILKGEYPPEVQGLLQPLVKLEQNLKQTRDCKTGSIRLAYVLEYLIQELDLPVSVRVAEIRAMPHPFIEVQITGEDPLYFDYSPQHKDVAVNGKTIMSKLELEQRKKPDTHPVVNFHPVNVETLAMIDRQYLFWTKRALTD